MDANQISQEILKQLGGNKFIAMTGSHTFMCDDKGNLSMKLRRNNSTFNYLKISLNDQDTYNMLFLKASPSKGITKEQKIENVYNDQLTKIFESTTGLRTSL